MGLTVLIALPSHDAPAPDYGPNVLDNLATSYRFMGFFLGNAASDCLCRIIAGLGFVQDWTRNCASTLSGAWCAHVVSFIAACCYIHACLAKAVKAGVVETAPTDLSSCFAGCRTWFLGAETKFCWLLALYAGDSDLGGGADCESNAKKVTFFCKEVIDPLFERHIMIVPQLIDC